MKKPLLLILSLFLQLQLLYSQDAIKTLEEKQREIIQYGTETEIANLVASLKKDNATYLNNDLIKLAQISNNAHILTGVFSFFTDLAQTGLETKAIELIQNRYDEQKEVVRSAIDYVGSVKAVEAIKPLQDIIDTEDKSFINSAIRAIGKIAGTDRVSNKQEIVAYLINYYKSGDPIDDDKNALIVSLGEIGSAESVDFIAAIATNADERPFRRMTALEALGKIKDQKGLPAILQGIQDSDPNVRATAVAALGPFTDKKVEDAILEAFRDSFYKTRIAAAKAAGDRKLVSAVPYLRFRSRNDEVPGVREASIKALGQIANAEAISVLIDLFKQKNNPDTIKIISAEMLMTIDAGTYSPEIINSYEEAKQQKQKPLQNGLAKVLSNGKSEDLKNLAKQFLTSTDVVEQSYGLQLAKNNRFSDLADLIKPLTDEKKYGSLARRARETLDALGITE